MQAICRDHSIVGIPKELLIDGKIDKTKITFSLYTQPVTDNFDIYEELLPAEVEPFLHVENGNRVMPGADPAKALGDAEATNSNRPIPEIDIPGTFLSEEDPPDGCNPNELDQTAELFRFQHEILTKTTKKLTAKSKVEREISPGEIEEMEVDAAQARFLEDAAMTPKEHRAFLDLMEIRWGEQYLGPDVLHAYDALGLSPDSSTPQLPGCLSTLHDSQVTGVAWMLAQFYGTVPQIASQMYDHPAYQRLQMKGSIIRDDMRLRKTIIALAFLQWIRNFTATIREENEDVVPDYRPSIVVAPTHIVYCGCSGYCRHSRLPQASRVIAEESIRAWVG